jgi:hypothetical protein
MQKKGKMTWFKKDEAFEVAWCAPFVDVLNHITTTSAAANLNGV